MRYIWALLLCLTVSSDVLAQQPHPAFYGEIQLKHKPYTLQSITEEIQAQTGISFSYDASKIDPNTRIRLKGSKLTVAAILGTVQKKTHIGYKVISQKHIIYVAAAGPQQRAEKPGKLRYRTRKGSKATPQKNVASQPAPVKGYNIAKTSTIVDPGEQSNIVIVGDSSAVSAYYFGGGYGGGGGNGEKEEEETPSDYPDNEWDDMPNRYAARKSSLSKDDVLNFFKANTLFAAGISVDETYYLNPTVRMGFDFLYGTVSYSMGSPNTWRFGVGASAKISEKWHLHVNISTGRPISNNYDILKYDTIPPQDSSQTPTLVESHTPLAVSAKLTRYGISTSYNLGRGFLLEGGLVLNRLTTNYYSNSNPVNLSDILPFGLDADSKYYGIKPPYTMGNNYSANTPSNTKIWIGVQLTFLYRLNFLGY